MHSPSSIPAGTIRGNTVRQRVCIIIHMKVRGVRSTSGPSIYFYLIPPWPWLSCRSTVQLLDRMLQGYVFKIPYTLVLYGNNWTRARSRGLIYYSTRLRLVLYILAS